MIDIKNSNIKNILHISHTDLDGYMSSYLSKIILEPIIEDLKIDYINCGPNQVYDLLKNNIKEYDNNYDLIIITDLNLQEKTYELIKSSIYMEKLLWFDHHITNIKFTKEDKDIFNIFTIFDGHKTCGTELYYKFLYYKFIKRIMDNDYITPTHIKIDWLYNVVYLTTLYDTYEWKNEIGKYYILPTRLNTLFGVLKNIYEDNSNKEDPFDSAFFRYIYRYITDFEFGFDEFLKDELTNTIISIKDIENENYVELKNKDIHIFNVSIKGITYKAGFVIVDGKTINISNLGNRLCELNPDLDFIGMIYDNIISYRTIKENINVRDIAVAILPESGGHQKASGSTYNTNYSYTIYDNLIFKFISVGNAYISKPKHFEEK